MSKQKYLKTDDLNEAVRDLEMVRRFLEKLNSEIYYWKWVILALHSSLQGFMVAALKGSSGLNVLTDKSAEGWLKAHQADLRTFPRLKLDTFLNLYEKMKTDKILMYHGSKKFVSTEEQDRSVKKLNSRRNDYIHFKPMRRIIYTAGLPQDAKECLSVIKFLALDSGNIWFMKGYSSNKIEQLIKRIDRVLDELAMRYRPDT